MTTTSGIELDLPTGPLGATAATPIVERPAVPGFEIGEPLGRGGMGVVFKAREVATARDVALKWLPSSADEALRKRFEREARAAAAVRHAHIVPVLSAGSVPGGAYIVMELVDGFSLGAALSARALGRNALVDLLAKVARALHAAHESGVVHRDVKPENIVVDAHGEPRLLDFGLARFLEAEGQLTQQNQALGTLGYMAPEVVAGGGATAGPPCDVFALGALLHEGLAGEPAFGAGPTQTVVARMERGELSPLPAGTPPELAALARAALDRDPAKRPTALAFAEGLEASAKPASAQVPPLPPPAPPRASYAGLIATGLVGVAIGGVLVGLALRKPAHEEASLAAAGGAAGAVAFAPQPEPAPVPTQAAPAPSPSPDDELQAVMGALALGDLAKADALARAAIAHAAPGDRSAARFHVVLGRDALMDLRTAEAQREYAKALELDPAEPHALLGSYATALVDGDQTLANQRFAALEEKGHSVNLACARALGAASRQEKLARFQLGAAANMPKADAALLKRIGPVLFREGRR